MKMGRYNAEFKESLLKKVFTKKDNISIHQIALEANVTPSILYDWVKKAKGQVLKVKNDDYESGKRFEFCLKYFNLTETEKGEFLRSNGLYSYQLETWKKDFINSNGNRNPKKNNLNKGDRNRIKILEKELRRKEKALAETATLLTLKKKFQDLEPDEE